MMLLSYAPTDGLFTAGINLAYSDNWIKFYMNVFCLFIIYR